MILKTVNAVDSWMRRWLPGIIAWPLVVVVGLLTLVLSALLMPPNSFKAFCKEIDDESSE